MSVRDDACGPGWRDEHPAGNGLVGLRERAAAAATGARSSSAVRRVVAMSTVQAGEPS